MRLTLFTSIPPRVVRRDRAGQDLGASYMQRCVASWIDAGHRLVSLNGADEAPEIAALHPRVEVRQVGRTAQAQLGRPLLYLHDVLQHCAASADERVGLLNADLLLHGPQAFEAFLAAGERDAVGYGSRLDVDALDDPASGRIYDSGIDCFFFAPEQVRELPDEGFVLGETWWDFWLPIVLAKRGGRLRRADAPLVLHLRHDESTIAMRSPTYLGFFQAFARALSVRLPLPGDEPWARQVRPLLAAFVRHHRPTNGPVEQIYLSQFLSLAVSRFLAQDPALFASVTTAWGGLCDRIADDGERRFAAALLDSATAAASA